MVQRHCRANPKVKECESSVTAIENTAVAIALKLVVSNETVLPEFTKALQDSLKEYIEMYCGITVRRFDRKCTGTCKAAAHNVRCMI